MIDLAASLEARHRQNAEGCVKTTEDLDRYRTVIGRVRPQLIVECGTFSGKSAAWLARTAGCQVVTIDVNDQVEADVYEQWRDLPILQYVGSTTSQGAYQFVLDAVNDTNGPVMLILDSDHSGAHVMHEMRYYARFVTPGSYMVVEDGLLRWMPAEEQAAYDGNPLDAINQWMNQHDDEWEIDFDIEAMHPVTQFPSGWLLRR